MTTPQSKRATRGSDGEWRDRTERPGPCQAVRVDGCGGLVGGELRAGVREQQVDVARQDRAGLLRGAGGFLELRHVGVDIAVQRVHLLGGNGSCEPARKP